MMCRLGDQVACYERLAKLTEDQRFHIERGDVESLLDVLQGRRVVLDRIAMTESVLGPVRGDWSVYVEGLDAATQAVATDLLAKIRRLLEEILAADQHDAIALQQRKAQ